MVLEQIEWQTIDQPAGSISQDFLVIIQDIGRVQALRS